MTRMHIPKPRIQLTTKPWGQGSRSRDDAPLESNSYWAQIFRHLVETSPEMWVSIAGNVVGVTLHAAMIESISVRRDSDFISVNIRQEAFPAIFSNEDNYAIAQIVEQHLREHFLCQNFHFEGLPCDLMVAL